MTVVNALSDMFIVTSWRDKENRFHELHFENGKLEKEIDRPLKKSEKRHGSRVKFRISKKYAGNEASFPLNDCINWLETQMYFPMANDKMKIKFDVFEGMKLIDTYKFKPKEFIGLLDKITPSNDDEKFAPSIYISGDRTLEEYIKNKKVTKKLHLDVAITYVNDTNTIYDSYCNYGVTIDGGVHVDAVNKSFCNFMVFKTKSTMTDNQKDKLPITWDDVKSGLCCVIALTTDAQVSFQGNAKTKIGNTDLIPIMSNIVSTELDNYFSRNPRVLDTFIKIIKINAKSRLEMQEMKNATQTERMNNFKELTLKNYTPPINKGKHQFRQLYIVEGDSANPRDSSNPLTDGLYLLRGVTKNPVKSSLGKVMENKELSGLVNVLRCGIGKNFNLENLYFDRINIFTDADCDGYGISDQVISFFYTHMKPIIEAGKLYKVFTPLYELVDGKHHIYAKNKHELIDIYHSKIIKNFKIKLIGNDDYMTKSELQVFLEDTYEYRDNLIRAAESLGKTNKFLVEAAIAYLVLVAKANNEDINDIDSLLDKQKFITKYMENIQKKFKEIKLDNEHNLRGVVDDKYCLIKLSSRFLKKTSDLLSVYEKYGYFLKVKEKDNEPVKMTIGEFLDSCMRYFLKIETRFKGLGELNADQLRDNAMDFNNRVSVRYTVDMAKAEHERAIINMLHNDSKSDMDKRKKLMKEFKIDRDDLDN